MYIHIGNKKIVSGRKCIGIFNAVTVLLSDENRWMQKNMGKEDCSVILLDDNEIIASNVSPHTIIKRTSFIKDFVWRRYNE